MSTAALGYHKVVKENKNLHNKVQVLKEFQQYAEEDKTLPESPTNEDKLILYELYKQSTVGSLNTSRPGMFYMRDRAKSDAAVKGKSEVIGDYITKVKELLEAVAYSTVPDES